MKVLYVIEGIAAKGGLERILIDKMNALVDSMDVTLLAVWRGQEEPAYRLDQRVQHISLDIPRPEGKIGFLFSLSRVLRRYNLTVKDINPDVVIHFRAIGAFLIGYGTHPCRTIFESHGVRYSNNHLWLYLRKERNVDTIVCLTEGDRQEYLVQKRCTDVRVIPNFTNVQPSSEPNIEAKNCVFIGRYCYEKNPERLLSLWGRIHDIHPDWTLDIYGEGWTEEALPSTLLHADKHVNLHGNTNNVAQCLSQASILLLTSRTEGFGLTILEAMKCAVPVVSLDTPYGPSDLIDNAVTGYCTPYHDDDAFVSAVSTLMNDASLRLSMGRAANERAKRFDKSVIMKQWLDLLTTN